ncbi:MAG: hypothetical protein COU11_02815, partial [Candidatus Harrisonbacteria bacterium CG10_big_fil_rev_8_21_14_0_10_49_15]
MSTLTRKVAAGFITATTVMSLSGLSAAIVPVAHAQTSADLQAQITLLLSQIATLQAQLNTGGSSSAACTFTRSLTVGSTGQDVMCLQQYLNGAGFTVSASGAGAPGMETTFFGSRTTAAVAAWQAANGVAPAVGYFGPISMAKYTQLNATVVVPPVAGGDDDDDDDSSDTSLQGGAGSITDADFIASLNNEEVGENEEDVQVAGLEIEAGEDSDIELIAVTLDFDKAADQSSGNDDDLDDYADEVSVWFDGEEVARVDASEFNDNNGYGRTVSLKSGAIIRADKTGELVVAVSGVKNLDSSNAAQAWDVAFEAVRFRDAQGAVITESDQGDIDSGTADTTAVTADAERAFTFETFATASDVEFKIMSGSDSINDSRVIDVDDTNDTDNVDVFSFVVRIDGTSDVQLKDLMLSSTHTGTANTLDDVFSKLVLEMDGVVVGSESSSFAGATTVVFDDIDTWLEAGEDYSFTLVGDINDTQASQLVDGDTVYFTFGETETDSTLTDIEDEKGDNLADADKTGEETSDAIAFYDNGIEITSFNTTGSIAVATDGVNNDRVELVMNFTVHNFGDTTLYIPNTATNTGSVISTGVTTTAPGVSEGIGYVVQNSASTSAGSNDISATLTEEDTDLTLGTNAFELKAGKSGTFTLKVSVANDGTPDLTNTTFRAFLTGVNWASADAANGDSVYTF